MIHAIRAATLTDALGELARLIAEREAAGQENVIFCEDRLTLLAERAVLRHSGGTFLSEVTTFARYLQTDAPVLSKEGSVMKINELLQKRQGEGCFTGGSARAVYETIAQLSASRVRAEMLLSAAQDTEGVLKRKTQELARLMEEYEAFLRESGLIDENGYLALLPEKISSGGLGEKNVFFFAFPSFTKQALEGVEAAFRNAANVTGIFLGGKESVYTEHALSAYLHRAEECGLECTLSTAPSSLDKEAEALLYGLFLPVAEEPVQAERIFAFEEQDETEELEKIASLIRMHVALGARYREITVLVPGADYFLTAEKVFSSYKIPFYLERKRPLSEHPFAGYVLSILDGVADGVLPDEADAIASNVCFGKADEYRNYLLRYGAFRGGWKHEIKPQEEIGDFNRERLLPFAKKMKAVLELFPRKAKAADYVAAVKKLFIETDWQSVLEGLRADAGETGEGFSPAEENFLALELTPEHSFGRTLDEIVRVVGEREFRVREFASLLKSGLEANEVLLIPPALDAVFIGDITESKTACSKILFAAGLTENLPAVSEDTAIIQDHEMKRLKEIKVEIEPAIREVNMRLRESFALNLAGFSERLYLSRPLRLHGEETQRSEALVFARRRFLLPALPDVFPYDCSERTPAALRMIRERQGEGTNACRYNAIHSALEEEGALPRERDEHPLDERAAALWMKNESVSPTLLESYFECPYKGFMTRALHLTEKREGGTNEADAGVFVHTVLERAAKTFNTLREESIEEEVTRIAEALFEEPRFRPLADTAEGRYMKERLLKDCVTVTRAAYRQLALSSFRVKETEEALTLPALRLTGKADRVDEAEKLVRVIDYKTGYFDDSPIAYYTGRKLQLELYLIASATEKEPAGAFYFPAADVYAKEGEEARFCMRGFYNAEGDVVSEFDRTLSEGEKSTLFDDTRVKSKAGISIKEGARGMKREDFKDFLDYACLVSEGAEREMQEGNFAPSPYGDACERCRMKSLCAFTGEARKEPDCNSAEICAVVRGKKES